jgi:hypothetical protein
MPKVTHQRSRNGIPSINVAPGEMYYKWKMKTATGGVKRVSKTPPRPSQLTLSEFKSSWRSFSEEIDDMELDDSLYDNLQELAGRIRELGNECEEKRSNMPENLQDAPSGELLETRKNNCESWADEIEGLNKPDEPNEEDIRAGIEREEGQSDDAYKAAQDEAWETANEEYKTELNTLKEDAQNADPGEE